MSVLSPHVGRRLLGPFASIGQQLIFHGRVLAGVGHTLRRHPKEILRLVGEVSLGSGGLALIGGTVAVVVFMTAAIGVEIGLQGYSSLSSVGVEALAGFMSSYANTREGAPLLAGIGLTATVGAGFTAQLGAMRVSEEIDALEVMAVPAISFLVTSRIIAGIVAIVPLYAMALLGSYAATKLVVVEFFGQSAGTYGHYFMTFLRPEDIAWSLVKVIAMALFVMLVHCHAGFTATGGPAGVGRAVGSAVRTSLISVMMIDLLIDLAVYGGPSQIHVAG